MAHIHSIYDTDPHFKIDGKTRKVTNLSDVKAVIFQYDHNSERFTFELPKLIDGHDMTLCDTVEIHWVNTDASSGKSNTGIYNVTDTQVSPADDNVLICSWLISNEITQLVGSLSFIVRFICTGDDGTIEYAWSTAVHSGVTVAYSIDNTER
jgi:hypothetical protein